MARMNKALRRGLERYWSQDYVETYALLAPLAVAGNHIAQSAIGSMYHMGLGVEINATEAIYWYKESASRGSTLACNNLHTIYLSGWYEIPQDEAEAQQWHEKAKQRGFFGFPQESF